MKNFKKLLEINVNDKTEKKNNLTYLSWAWAWAEFCKENPTARYEILKTDSGMPYFKDDSGAFVFTRVTVEETTHEMWLPVLDYRNKPLTNPNAFDVNKSLMRCLTKNLAMFGLGLYIYAGEDMPEGEELPEQKQQPKKPKNVPKKLDSKPAVNYKLELTNVLKAVGMEMEDIKNFILLQYNKPSITNEEAEQLLRKIESGEITFEDDFPVDCSA